MKERKVSKEPIKSQEEANEVFEYLVQTTIDTLGVDRTQAEKRITALINSGWLNGTEHSPTNPVTQRMIDNFMRTPIN